MLRCPAKRLLLLIAALALLLGLSAALLQRLLDPLPAAADVPGLLWPNPKVLAPFQLTDQYEQPFGLERMAGKWNFLFFGYTHCPDICPMTLATLAEVHRMLAERGEGAGDLQYVFVSVDPERDTPEHLKQYVRFFNPDFLGVSGPEERLAALTRQIGIVYFKEKADPGGAYLVDHTASILLVDPRGRLVGIFGMPHAAPEIAERFTAMRRIVGG